MNQAKQLLILYHSQSGNTARLAQAVFSGSRAAGVVDARLQRAFDSDAQDLLACNGLLLGSPENFGYMSGGLKDFFDRTFYPCEGLLAALPYAVFISAGNDGRGAVREINRIANGYGWKQVAEAIIVRRRITSADLDQCKQLGEAFAHGLEQGIF